MGAVGVGLLSTCSCSLLALVEAIVVGLEEAAVGLGLAGIGGKYVSHAFK